jgi:hypothetical protein
MAYRSSPRPSAYSIGFQEGLTAGRRAFFWRGVLAGVFVAASLVAVLLHEGILR